MGQIIFPVIYCICFIGQLLLGSEHGFLFSFACHMRWR
jgi:hypothetical protein